MDPDELARRIQAEGYSIVVVEADFLPAEIFQSAVGGALRLLGVCRSRLDHVDVEAATRHGVAVVNTPGRNAQAVAELTIGLMLALARRLCTLDAYVKEGRWQNPVEPYLHMGGSELAGKTLGILGLGRVGRRVARLAQAFDMRVLAYDPPLASALSPTARGLPAHHRADGAQVGSAGPAHEDQPGAIGGSGSLSSFLGSEIDSFGDIQVMATLPELVSQCDYLSIHVPDIPQTEGLLGQDVLALAKPGCRLINTGSYRAVDEAALVNALQQGRLAGAAFDVFETHPIMPDSPLLRLDNVVLTPHVGGATLETVARHSQMMVEDIGRFLQGLRPRHLVNPESWGSGG
jgi:phosphoglycerate dehydrogenase-like enzyme